MEDARVADTRDVPTRVADALTGREIGSIWWIADNQAEAESWVTRYMDAGALAVRIIAHCAPGDTAYDVIITMHKDMFGQVLGAGISEADWLE